MTTGGTARFDNYANSNGDGPPSFAFGLNTPNGTFNASADYTITTIDGYRTISMTTSSTTRVVTLPAVASSSSRMLTIEKIDSGTGLVTITPNGGTINGNATWTLNGRYAAVNLYCDGTAWYIAASTAGQSNIILVSSANYTVLNADGQTIEVTTGASDRTITLPSVSANTGRVLTFKKVDSGSGKIIVSPAGADLIDGSAKNRLSAQYSYLTIQSNGTNWDILAVSDQLGSTATDVTVATNVAASATYFDAISFLLPEGTWWASGAVRYSRNGATFTSVQFDTGFQTTSGNSAPTTDSRGYIDVGASLTTFADWTLDTKQYITTVTNNTTTLYLKGYAATITAGTAQYTASMRLVRIR